MIAKLSGKIIQKELKFLVLDIGGVGYKVYSTPHTISKSKEGKELSLWTHLAVRENSMDLYGFIDIEERDFFELLISVSGIGPKGAIGVLTVADVKTLRTAISTGDTSYMTKVSGIGKKSAEKIVLELQDKIGSLSGDGDMSLREEAEALEALKAIGYRHDEAREALKVVPKEITTTSERVREALRVLGK